MLGAKGFAPFSTTAIMHCNIIVFRVVAKRSAKQEVDNTIERSQLFNFVVVCDTIGSLRGCLYLLP